ncbi:AraC family transcriptional regulator [Desmospora activa]|uniref:AraC-like protein n=1 Tax=Desmospora activa DSM 45169 TaxID=1121389 RepID=A0A2T4ZBA7_9BACL|nr:AraC family transcriptional regulator [Desmospora activa]PTM59178.1 AraC-like protein [Desmospora activa DSM 45169]
MNKEKPAFVKKSIGDIRDGLIRISHHQTKTPEEELPHHLHDWHEVICVHKGSGTFLIDQQLYEVRAEDVFVIPGNIIHRAMPENDHLITSTVIFLHPLVMAQITDHEANIIREAKKRKQYRYHILAEQRQTFAYLLQKLQAESQSPLHGHQQAIAAWVQLCLLEISRHSLQAEESPHRPNLSTFNHVLRYIDDHLEQALSLDLLAAKERISTAHFSRLFKQEVGLNLTDYLLTKRISLAKTLLLETDENISTIAEKCGFRSLPHFYRSFKRVTRQTPRGYRQEVGKSHQSK